MLRTRFALAAALAAAAIHLPAAALEGHRVWYRGQEINVVDQDGLAMYDGDIILGRTQDILARSLAEGPNGTRIGSLAKSVMLGVADGRWPRNSSGVYEMAYVIETDPDGNVPAAVQAFNDQLAGFLRAVPYTNQPDYVAFTLSASDTSGACSSSVGRVGGRQVIQGSRTCSGGTLVHEMGHATGLWHEQQHAERNAYVTFNLDNLDPARASNFSVSANQKSGTPYDYASIMHYSATSFAKTGFPTMETIPAGIAIGARAGFSVADIEGIKRLYGAPPQSVTVTTFPAGLSVIVDGATVTTPASFNWTLGSTHTIDVPSNVQVANGVAHVFGRWNVDRSGDLAARRTITVAPGDGSITAPATLPAISTYTANFVRYKEVRLTTSGNKAGIGGSVNANPAPVTLPGVSGTFYRERQAFSLEPVANAGSTFGSWSGSYSFFVAYTTSHRVPYRGPVTISDTGNTVFEYRAAFFDFPMLTVQGRAQDGEVLGVRATITPSGGTAVDQRLPYNATAWTSGQSGTLAMATTALQPFATTMRYTFLNWDGDPTATITVASPQAGQANRVVTANFNKEYQAFKQVIPSCAAAMTLTNDPAGWYPHGSALTATLSPAAGWTFVGWEGSLSGTSLNPTLTVNDFPNLVARFNTTNAPLAVTGLSPASVTAATAATITIDGTGFTPASEVYVNGARVSSQFVSANRLFATPALADLPASGAAIITVTNRPSPNACSVSSSGAIDVLPVAGAATITPQTGWWWNPAEGGRGFFIEKAGGNLFMAGYFYEADGRATWVSASGPVNGNAFAADMIPFRGGQTLTGNYVAPTQAASPGRITLDFTATDRATLSWPGGTVQLQRFGFGAGGATGGENGWWWNSAEGGRGFSIETQGNAIFMAGFMYDAAGNPIWYAAQGALSGGNTFNGTWQQFGGGQTLTGAYKPASIVNAAVGSLTLAFTGSRAATLTLPNGRQVSLTRFTF